MKSANRKPQTAIAGYMLFECLVYISVLMILLGLGFGAFYACWDKSKSLRYHADDISRALRAGEQWRADIRGATGRIVAHSADDGQMVEIPVRTNSILYVFTAGQVSRKLNSAEQWTVVLPKVATSQMQADPRTRVTAWRWDVELVPTRAQVRILPRFAFEAVPSAVR
jgi:Tfp pilus assembly protein FimT